MSLLISAKVLIISLWVLSLFCVERIFNAAQYPDGFSIKQQYQRLISNLSISAINMVLSPLLIIPLTVWIGSAFGSWRPDSMQGALFFLLDILLLDCFLYGWHRLSHRLPILWRFHEVHHLDKFLDTTTALRFHFGEVFISAIVRAGFIVALGIPVETVIIFEIMIVVFSVFNHSNLRLPKALEQHLSTVIVTPSIHWVHHHAKRRDTDSNYATIFSFWDKCFSTSSANKRELSMPLGVEGKQELPLLSLLLRPFK